MKLLLIWVFIFFFGLLGFNFLLVYVLGVLDWDVDKCGYVFDCYCWGEFYELLKGDSLDIFFLGFLYVYWGFDLKLLEEW